MTAASRPVAHAGEGEAFWWLGALVTVKTPSSQTDGRLTVLELEAPAGFALPTHVHHREDEVLHVLGGELSTRIGDFIVHAGTGATVLAPRGVPHRLVVGAEPARVLTMLAPGGFDGLIREMGEPARRRTLPTRLRRADDEERLRRIARAHGVEILA